MNFITWIFRRIKNSQFEWVQGYHRLILEEFFLSIVFTLVCGVILYIVPVGFLLIHFIDHQATAEFTLLVLTLSVPLFYVYHWIRALHGVYELEKKKFWQELKR